MDILTNDDVVIEIGKIDIEEPTKYQINGREYTGISYRAIQGIDVPEFIKAGQYRYDGANFIPCTGNANTRSNQQTLILLEQLNQKLNKMQENQKAQETMLIECFTDLDAALNNK